MLFLVLNIRYEYSPSIVSKPSAERSFAYARTCPVRVVPGAVACTPFMACNFEPVLIRYASALLTQ